MDNKKAEEIVKQVKDCAVEVYRVLGAGYEERVYEEAMAVEFRRRGIPYEVERDVEVFYKGEKVGIHKLDFIVMDSQFKSILVVELKSASKIYPSHIAQVGSYLRTLNVPMGLLVNFPYPEAEAPEMELVRLVKKKNLPVQYKNPC